MQSYATNEASLAAPTPAPVRGEKKRWILNAFDMATSGHQFPGLWKHPLDRSANYHDIEYWTHLAKTLEKGKFNGIFIADTLGAYDIYNGNLDAAARTGAQWGVDDPTLLGEDSFPTLCQFRSRMPKKDAAWNNVGSWIN